MRWIGNGCLGLGGGRFIFRDETIPSGILSLDRIAELVAAGKIVLDDGDIPAPIPFAEPEIPRVTVSAPKPEAPKPEAPKDEPKEEAPKPKKRKRGRPRKKKVAE